MITVSISSYNQGKYLTDAIESLIAQTVRPYEILIIDDGSTDNSLEIARDYEKDKELYGVNIRVISKLNGGLSSARNTGIMNAKGEYFLPLDADDKLDENCIERMEQVIKKTGMDIVAPSMHTFGTSDQVIILMPNPTTEDFKTGNRIPYCSAIKTELLKSVGGYQTKGMIGNCGYEDYHLWFNLLSRGAKITVIQEPLFWYRTKEESMWHDAVKNHKELMAQIHKDFPEVTNVINDPLPK